MNQQIKDSIPGAGYSIIQPFKELATNAPKFFNKDTTREERKNIASDAINSAMTIFGAGKMLSATGKMASSVKVGVIQASTGQLAVVTSVSTELAVTAAKEAALGANVMYAAAGNGGGDGDEVSSNSPNYNFANQKKFDKHYDKHVVKQGEFGNITKDQYLQKANEFANSSGSNVLTRTGSNEDVLKFNPSTDEFSIVTKDGVIRTYHKLDPSIHGKGTNMNYWNGPDCNY